MSCPRGIRRGRAGRPGDLLVLDEGDVLRSARRRA